MVPFAVACCIVAFSDVERDKRAFIGPYTFCLAEVEVKMRGVLVGKKKNRLHSQPRRVKTYVLQLLGEKVICFFVCNCAGVENL